MILAEFFSVALVFSKACAEFTSTEKEISKVRVKKIKEISSLYPPYKLVF